jgi:uncharacterized membrane protein YoaK (UPF0700 family)
VVWRPALVVITIVSVVSFIVVLFVSLVFTLSVVAVVVFVIAVRFVVSIVVEQARSVERRGAGRSAVASGERGTTTSGRRDAHEECADQAECDERSHSGACRE